MLLWLDKKQKQYLIEVMNMLWNSKTMGYKVETPTNEEMSLILGILQKLR